MTKEELQQLFGNNLSDEFIVEMSMTWDENSVNDYLIDTGYNADCKDVVISLRREAKVIMDGK